MTSVAHIHDASSKRDIRLARAAFIRGLIEAEDRSVRYVAHKIGLSPSTMGERLSGKNAFLADEIEALAPILRKTPVELYREYLLCTPRDLNPEPTGYGLAPARQVAVKPKGRTRRNSAPRGRAN